MLADWRGHLIEIALRLPIRRRLDLEVAASTFEIVVDLGHLLRAVDGVIDLQVLQGDLLAVGSILVRVLQVDIRIFRTLQASLGVLGAFLSAVVELLSFRN